MQLARGSRARLPGLPAGQDRWRSIKDQQKDLLRGLIDQSLLVQRAKDMGISVETDVIKRLDDVRKQNSLASMEDLEKAVEDVGLGLGRLQDADSQRPADAGSDPPAKWARTSTLPPTK